MNSSAHREEEIFAAAVQLPIEQRTAYLDQACAGDTVLRQRIEGLLGALDRASPLLRGPPPFAKTLPCLPPSEKPGDRIGRYKLLEQIGEGGCGVVYVAEQEEPVRRRVALKVIKLGMDTKQVIARFDAERQALAMMDHPNIAKIHDAGVTETGRPYFVMELVRGIKITDYCDQNHLSPRERLDLFIQVCRAIQHAHQKGVIHRDIKPSNILVTLHDGVPVPKVIDFGIAKATQGRLTDQTVYTAFEQFIGTPAYMSPEQAELSGLDIDTRSDIYSLGVLLYELLTGKTPFDAKELLAAGLDEMRRTIREVEPVKPSTRITQDLVAADVRRLTSKSEEKIRASLRRLLQEVRGDLDWIVMKCLEKDRTRRYETANGLATDLSRHLNNEPIVARPPSRLYRFQKTVQRNKLVFAAASAVVAALVIGLTVSTAMYFKAQAEKKKAQTESAKSQQVAEFLKDMLGGVGPWVAQGRDTTLLRGILDKTAQRLATDLKEQPEVQVELLHVIGSTYFETGPLNKAETLLRKALAIEKSLPGDHRADIAAMLHSLGMVLWRQEQLADAEATMRESLAIARTLPDERNQTLMDSLIDLGGIFVNQGKPAEAETIEREAIRRARNPDGTDRPKVVWALIFLGSALDLEGKFDEAEATFREVIAIARKRNGPDDLLLAESLRFLAEPLDHAGKLIEAETVLREALAVHRKVSDQLRSPHLAAALEQLAGVLNEQGKLAEAENLRGKASAIRRNIQGNTQAEASVHLGGQTNTATKARQSR
jgi:serine/threonine protein kinase/tetratricopeptide (TPR) repeat protein